MNFFVKRSTDPQNGRIETIETLRGLAALLVCLYHFRLSNMVFLGFSKYYVSIFSCGWAGVQIFFVISGFVIPYSMVKANYQLKDFGKFMLRRLARIEPPYIISILLIILLNLASTWAPGFNGAPFHINWMQLVSHLGYLPEHFGFHWLSPVYWSLESEFHFYILIALILPWLFSSRTAFTAGILLLLLCSFVIPLSAFKFMCFFVMGMATCFWKLNRLSAWQYVAFLFLAFVTPYFKDGGFSWGNFSIIASAFGLVTALLIAFVNYSNVIFRFLGKISFSLYLLHVPLGGRVINLAGRYAHTEAMVWLTLFLAIALSILAAYLFIFL